MKNNLFSSVTASNALSSYSLRRRRPFYLKRWFLGLIAILLGVSLLRLFAPDLMPGWLSGFLIG